jgi:hypothetical protein
MTLATPDVTLATRLAGGVWGHLVGDAVGVPYEFRTPDAIGEVRWGEGIEREFIEAISDPDHPTARIVALEFLAWMRRHGTEPTFGGGRTGPMYVNARSASGSLVGRISLGLSDYGRIEVLFNELKAAAPFDAIGPRMALRDRLNAIPGIEVAKRTAENANCTSFAVARISDQSVRRIFFDTVDWVGEQIRESGL